MKIRPAHPADAEGLAALLAAYLTESFPGHPGTDAARLRRDVLRPGASERVLLVEQGGVAAGFVTWRRVYDLHWAKAGVEVGDLYVEPARRGLGIAAALIAAVCAAGAAEGATYLRGTSFDRRSPAGRFYERIAVTSDTAECHCAGRAFRRLAELHAQPPRAIVRALPPKGWNYEP